MIGASAVIKQALLKGPPAGSWLAQMLARKPRMLVAVALANKTARIVWALMARGGIYRTQRWLPDQLRCGTRGVGRTKEGMAHSRRDGTEKTGAFLMPRARFG